MIGPVFLTETALTPTSIRAAATALAHATTSGIPLDHLPDDARPESFEEALAIQEETARLLGEAALGWKAALAAPSGVLYAGMLASRVFADGATIRSSRFRLIGVEAEIAFRFDRDLPPRAAAYSEDEVAAAVSALPAIETIDTRFGDLDAASPLERAADFLSNGCFVAGAACPTWRSLDLATLEVSLSIDGVEVVRKVGGHPSGNPLAVAVALANRLRLADGVKKGAVVTTGSVSGTLYVDKSSTIAVAFAGLGTVGCRFAP